MNIAPVLCVCVSRQVKNTETGVDLSVTSYKEVKGLVGSQFLYQVMVVSNLPCFKLAKHRDTDTVQFTVNHL